jgi:cytochrome c553
MNDLSWKQRLLPVVVFLAVCGILGALVVVAGLVPVNASSGHWAVTRWILDFAKSRSVATHSTGIDVPPLDDPALILKGAGHYETGCVQCHGSPSHPASPIALSMTATPPALPPKIEVREPQELFYIVKHGIKFTGMPAWPTQRRDDEVWAMIAFLQRLPSMDAEEYDRLTGRSLAAELPASDTEPSPLLLATCVRCHGSAGQGRGNGAYPRLAGLSSEYLLASLQAYAAGERHSGMMQPVAAVLTQEQLGELADYFAAQVAAPGSNDDETAGADAEGVGAKSSDERAVAIARGEKIAREGIPNQMVPSCIDCHGPSETPRAAAYPRLAGQHADYLALQLTLFRAGTRGGTASAHLMKPVVVGLTDDDIRDVAAYYGSLRKSSAVTATETGDDGD